MRMLLAAFLAIVCGSTTSRAEVHLDQLSACNDLVQTLDALQSNGSHCRPSSGVLEVTIEKWASTAPNVSTCFLEHAPSKALAQFQCMSADIQQNYRQLVCFRGAQQADIADFKARAPEYSERVSRYLKQATNCSVGNRDSARAPGTLFPQLLGFVARYEFGFVIPIGGKLVGTGTILHGYASVDPELRSGMAAIEFLSIGLPK